MTSTCVICTNKIIPSQENFQEQLIVVFFLKKFFNYSIFDKEDDDNKLRSLLRKKGNPTDWISFCSSCYEQLKKAQKAYASFSKLESKLESLRAGIERDVLDTFHNSKSRTGDKNLFNVVRGAIYSNQNSSANGKSLNSSSVLLSSSDIKLERTEEEELDEDDLMNMTLENLEAAAQSDDELGNSVRKKSSGKSTGSKRKKPSLPNKLSSAPRSKSSASTSKPLTLSSEQEDVKNNIKIESEELRTCTVCFEVFESSSFVTQHFISMHAKGSIPIIGINLHGKDLSNNQNDSFPLKISTENTDETDDYNEPDLSDYGPENDDFAMEDLPDADAGNKNNRSDVDIKAENSKKSKKSKKSSSPRQSKSKKNKRKNCIQMDDRVETPRLLEPRSLRKRSSLTYKTENTDDLESDINSGDDGDPEFSHNLSSASDSDNNDSDFELEAENSKKSKKSKRSSSPSQPKSRKRKPKDSTQTNDGEEKPKPKVPRYKNAAEKLVARTCPICQKVFAQPVARNRHINTIHQRNQICVCEKCGRSYMTQENLAAHMKRHENGDKAPRPFKCTHEGCDKAYVQKSALIGHQQVHKEVKDYVCKICGLSFTHRNSLERHHRGKHTDDKFVCDVCGKKFNFQVNLDRHVQGKHSGHKFVCNVCGREFSYKANLDSHLKIGTHRPRGNLKGTNGRNSNGSKPPKRIRKKKTKDNFSTVDLSLINMENPYMAHGWPM